MQKTVVIMTDDLTGEDFPPEKGETVSFALRGVEYVIDLTKSNAQELEKILTRYMRQGRRVKQLAHRARSHKPTQIDKYQRERIRQWAIDNGERVADRGAIAKRIIDRYNNEAGRTGLTG